MALLTGGNHFELPADYDVDTTGGWVTVPPDRAIDIIHMGVDASVAASTAYLIYRCYTKKQIVTDGVTPAIPANLAATINVQGAGILLPNQVLPVGPDVVQIHMKGSGTVKIKVNPGRRDPFSG